MLISDYLSSNIKFAFFYWTHIEEPRTEVQKYFRSIFGSNDSFKICFGD